MKGKDLNVNNKEIKIHYYVFKHPKILSKNRGL